MRVSGRLRGLFAVPLFAVLASCEILGVEQGCDICTLTARIRGEVTTIDGAAVVGATVTLRALYGAGAVGPCGWAESNAFLTVTTTTGSAGLFDESVGATSIMGPTCVEVSVEPPEASGLATAVDSIRAGFVGREDEPVAVDVVVVLEDEG